ncbi:MAG: sulfatase-like hydrolase/transferase, partial [Agromyces sp.]
VRDRDAMIEERGDRHRALGGRVTDVRPEGAPVDPAGPPAQPPNVLVILLDDVGFGASSAFGGPVSMPTADRLAGGGLRYSRFHTAVLGASTRAALLSGRSRHGADASPDTAVGLPEILRRNGYNTAQFGKCHEVPIRESGPTGPFDRWPTQSGFERFYGFIGGETSQYAPALIDGLTPIEAPNDPRYHLMPDLADKAIAYVRQQQSIAPDAPFFVYFAPGATHAPHHVPKEWIARYEGRFDAGWDVQREQTLARQRELGIVAADSELTARPEGLPAWDDVPDGRKPALARQMEVYAAFLEYADHHTGRLIDAIEELDVLEDTLVFYLLGDGGASAAGGVHGAYMLTAAANGGGDLETVEFWNEHLDDVGGPEAYNHYSSAWAHAMCTPDPLSEPATSPASPGDAPRTGAIVHWPGRLAASAAGEVREQWHHVVDLAPTVLDVAGIAAPGFVQGVGQESMHGASMAYSFDDASVELGRDQPPAPGAASRGDERALEHMKLDLAGCGSSSKGDRLRLYPGMTRLGEQVAINVRNRSFSVTAELAASDGRPIDGAIVVQGGRTGGWSFFAEDGRLGFHYNHCGLQRWTTLSDAAMGAGFHLVRVEFAYDGGGLGKGGDVTLFIDGKVVGTGRVEQTHTLYFSFDEGLDAGCDTGTPVYDGYKNRGGPLDGELEWAEVALGVDDHNHLVDPEEHLRAALRHQ